MVCAKTKMKLYILSTNLYLSFLLVNLQAILFWRKIHQTNANR